MDGVALSLQSEEHNWTKAEPAVFMNQKELKELIEFLIEKDIAEFELERGDVKVKIKRAAEPSSAALPDSRYIAVQSGAGCGAAGSGFCACPG